jgi:hypothetical protein
MNIREKHQENLDRQTRLNKRQLELDQITRELQKAYCEDNNKNVSEFWIIKVIKQIFKILYWLITFQLFKRLKRRKIARTISNNGLFDTGYYWEQNPDIKDSRVDPLGHYLDFGAIKGKNPHPLFDTKYYLSKYPEVEELGINPLFHYLTIGAEKGYNPHPLFKTAYYVEKYPEVINSGVNPLIHFLSIGTLQTNDPHPLFDSQYYLEKNPDVAQVSMNPAI